MDSESQDVLLPFPPLVDLLNEDNPGFFHNLDLEPESSNLDFNFGGEFNNLHNDTQDENTLYMEDMKCVYAPQLLPLPASTPLSNEEYSGPHDFEVSVLPVKSSNPWVYSVNLNKVYMDMNQRFPVDFKVSSRPDIPLFVRTTPQYTAQHEAGKPVFRCFQHNHPSDASNKDIAEHVKRHIIRTTNNLCQYVGDSKKNERLSILFPLSMPQVGNESVRELFYFVCKSTCPLPGIARRVLEIIFTLEDQHGRVYGRKCLNVRICSCPKRDKEKEEDKSKEQPESAMPKAKKRKSISPVSTHCHKVTVANDEPTPVDDFASINIKLTGKKNTLLKVLDLAELTVTADAYQTKFVTLLKKNLGVIQQAKNKLLLTASQSDDSSS